MLDLIKAQTSLHIYLSIFFVAYRITHDASTFETSYICTRIGCTWAIFEANPSGLFKVHLHVIPWTLCVWQFHNEIFHKIFIPAVLFCFTITSTGAIWCLPCHSMSWITRQRSKRGILLMYYIVKDKGQLYNSHNTKTFHISTSVTN